MSTETNIEWCDSTFNPWIGCTRVSPACDDCYAARSTPARALGVVWGPHEPRRRTSDANWREPLRWEKFHHAFEQHHGRRRRVFCASLADVFDNEVSPEWRAHLFCLIAATPNLDWLLLTKRIGNARAMIAEASATVEHYNPGIKPWTTTEPWPNVWIGATVCNQQEADRDIPKLDSTPAHIRFLSIEPMLGPIDIGWDRLWGAGSSNGIDWVITGGESGHHARPLNPEWVRSIRDQCAAAGVPYLHKQNGEFVSVSEVDGHGRHHTFEDGRTVRRVTKKLAGRLLDGVEHNGFPT